MMSWLHFCVFFFSVSNEVPETPVISPVSGHIFEKRLIEKYIQDNGTDPIANEKLSVDQLIPVKSEKGLFFFVCLFFTKDRGIEEKN